MLTQQQLKMLPVPPNFNLIYDPNPFTNCPSHLNSRQPCLYLSNFVTALHAHMYTDFNIGTFVSLGCRLPWMKKKKMVKTQQSIYGSENNGNNQQNSKQMSPVKNYLYLLIQDSPSQADKMLRYIPKVLQFLDLCSSTSPNLNVLIHCKVGRSRSPTVMIVYLIHRYNYTLEQAYNLLKFKIPQIKINIGFISVLQQFYSSRFSVVKQKFIYEPVTRSFINSQQEETNNQQNEGQQYSICNKQAQQLTELSASSRKYSHYTYQSVKSFYKELQTLQYSAGVIQKNIKNLRKQLRKNQNKGKIIQSQLKQNIQRGKASRRASLDLKSQSYQKKTRTQILVKQQQETKKQMKKQRQQRKQQLQQKQRAKQKILKKLQQKMLERKRKERQEESKPQ